jgi:signal transduction histidine kinase
MPHMDDLVLLKIAKESGDPSFLGLKVKPREMDNVSSSLYFRQIINLFLRAFNRFNLEMMRKQYEDELKKSNQSWKMLAKNARDIIMLCEINGTISHYNHLEFSGEDTNIQGYSIYDGVHPEDLQKMIDAISKSIESEEPQQLVFRGQQWLGDEIYLIHIRSISHNNRILLILNLTNYTEIHRARKKNKDQRLLLDMVLNGTQAGIILTSEDNVIEYSNKYFATLFHSDVFALVGRSLGDFFDTSQQEIIKRETQKRKKGQTSNFELVYTSGDDRNTLLVFSSPRFDSEGKFLGSFQAFSNITKYKELEKTISDERSKLRDLSEHLLAVREKERLKFSREIHDELGQQLTAVLMSLKYQNSRTNLSEELSQEICLMIDIVRGMLVRTKNLAGLLYPIMLDDLGLTASIEWLCEEMQEKTKIPVDLKISGDDGSLKDKIKISVYRLFQEALSNAIRYSQSADIYLEMEILPEVIKGTVKDSGVGFNKEDISTKGFYGIFGMEERIKFVKGKLDIISKPGQGTSVEFSIPLGEN